MTGFEKLENSLIDVIKEEQAKLGFKEEKIHLYYPLSSLNHFFSAKDNADEMAARLSQSKLFFLSHSRCEWKSRIPSQ